MAAREEMLTMCPPSTGCRAMASPIPELAPVTTAVPSMSPSRKNFWREAGDRFSQNLTGKIVPRQPYEFDCP